MLLDISAECKPDSTIRLHLECSSKENLRKLTPDPETSDTKAVGMNSVISSVWEYLSLLQIKVQHVVFVLPGGFMLYCFSVSPVVLTFDLCG